MANPGFRRKRSDTKMGTVEETHGVDFDVRSDLQLGKFLKENGFKSLSKALESARKNTPAKTPHAKALENAKNPPKRKS